MGTSGVALSMSDKDDTADSDPVSLCAVSSLEAPGDCGEDSCNTVAFTTGSSPAGDGVDSARGDGGPLKELRRALMAQKMTTSNFVSVVSNTLSCGICRFRCHKVWVPRFN